MAKWKKNIMKNSGGSKLDTYSPVTPLCLIMQLVGLAPVKFVDVLGKRHLQPSVLGLYHASLEIVIILLIYLYEITFISEDQVLSSKWVIFQLNFSLDIFLAILGLLLNSFHYKKFISILYKISLIDATFEDVEEVHHKSYIFVIFQLFLAICAFSANLSVLFYKFLYIDTITINFFAGWTIFFIHRLIIYLSILQYNCWLMLIQQRFKLINTNMRKHRTRCRWEVIRKMADIHSCCSDFASEVNSIFSVMLLLFSASILVNCLLETALFALWTNEDSQMEEVVISLVLMLALLPQFLFLVAVSTWTAEEANCTSSGVHKLLLNRDFKTDERLKKELVHFSLQLLHRKVCFTACGFFPVDATLISTIIGGITTYMVILGQFQTLSKHAI